MDSTRAGTGHGRPAAGLGSAIGSGSRSAATAARGRIGPGMGIAEKSRQRVHSGAACVYMGLHPRR